MRREIWLACGFGLAAGMVVGSVALGGDVNATLHNPSAAVFSSASDLNVAAYSEEDSEKNEFVNSLVVLNGSTAVAPADYEFGVGLTGQKIAAVVGSLPGNISPHFALLSPVAQVVGPNGTDLTTGGLVEPGDAVSISSDTGNYGGVSTVVNATDPSTDQLLPKYTLNAEAYVDPSETSPGLSAASGSDLLNIPAGTYLYDPTVDCSIRVDPNNQKAAARIYAVDDNSFTSDGVDHFVIDGEPMDQALWSLWRYDSQGKYVGIINWNFELNPAALSEISFPADYLASLGLYSDPESEAALIDRSINTALENYLDKHGWSLVDFDPFPMGTTYTPLVVGEGYASGVDSAIFIPEPWSLPAAMVLIMFVLADSRRCPTFRRR